MKIKEILVDGKSVDIKLFIKRTGLKESTLIQMSLSGIPVKSWGGKSCEIILEE